MQHSTKSSSILFLGVLLCLLGLAEIFHASTATTFSLGIMGFFLCVSGVLLEVHALYIRYWKGMFLSALIGIVSLLVGGLCLFQPLESGFAIASLLSAFFISIGCIQICTAWYIRYHRWIFNVIIGFLSFSFGVFIFPHWPFSTIWILGIFVGINTCLIGMSLLLFSETLYVEK